MPVRGMWVLDFSEHDPDANCPAPSAAQVLVADHADYLVGEVKRTLEQLTVPQQRRILGKLRDELVGGVYRECYPNGGPGTSRGSRR
jgi:hypothetical protein